MSTLATLFRTHGLPGEIHRGVGVRRAIPDIIRRHGWQRALVVAGARVRAGSSLVATIEQSLGARYAGTFDVVAVHNPAGALQASAASLRALRPDVILSVGGGSVHDTAKALAILIPSGTVAAPVSELLASDPFELSAAVKAPLPLVTVPTTFSAAEVVPGGAYTDSLGVKRLFTHRALRIAAVVLDAEMAASTPQRILAESAMNAVHHCIESAYSAGSQPLTSALAAYAFGCLMRSLPEVGTDSKVTLDAIQIALDGSSTSGLAYANSHLGLGHAICHSLGGRFGLAHGAANAVMVHHSLRFNMDAAANSLDPLSAVAGSSLRGADAVRHIQSQLDGLANVLGTPRRLRDLGLPHDVFDTIADDTMQDPLVQWNPRSVQRDDVIRLLDEAW